MAAAKGRPRRGYATVPVLVRFPVTMLERIAAYHAQIVSQDWRLTSRHDAILLLCERGLQEVERGPAPFTPPTAVADIDDATRNSQTSPPSPDIAPPPRKKRRSHAMPPRTLERVAAERRQHPAMPLKVFAEHLYTKNIYRAHGKNGEDQPAAKGFLYRWLKEAKEAGLL